MRRTAEEQLHRVQVAELPPIDRLTRVELLLVEGHPFEIPTDLERSARRHIGNRDARTREVETQSFGACFGHEPPSSAPGQPIGSTFGRLNEGDPGRTSRSPRCWRGHCPNLGRASAVPGWQAALGAGDRKSTRLNSSHTVISYAVF